MAAFSYTALDTSGKNIKGVVEADSARLARQSLRDQGLMPLNIDLASQAVESGSSGFSFSKPGLSVSELALITRQLATLVQASIPLEEALATVAKQAEKAKIRGILMSVRTKVLEGYTLAAAMGDFPNAFSELYRATVEAGESAGHLDGVLERLADYAESSQESRQKVQMAMIYPSILLVMAIAVVVGLMVFVVPDIVKVFTTQGGELPGITRAMISISDFINTRGWLLLAMMVGAYFFFRTLLRNPASEQAWHRMLLGLPLIGRFAVGSNTAQFTSTLSILTRSGVPLVEALKIGSRVLQNKWLRMQLTDATQQVQEGTSLHKALEQSGYFPPMMLHMIASGEKSGELDEMLDRTAKAQQRDLDSMIAVMLGILEPLMLMIMGVCVFVIVLAILLPIVELNSSF